MLSAFKHLLVMRIPNAKFCSVVDILDDSFNYNEMRLFRGSLKSSTYSNIEGDIRETRSQV